MRKYWIPISMFCAMFLQGTLIPALFKSTSGPNLVLTFVLVLTLVKGKKTGLVGAVVLGLYHDLLVGQYVGLNVAMMIALVLLVSHIEQFLFKNSLVTPALIITGSTLAKEFLFLVIVYALGFKTAFSFVILKKMLTMSALNAIIGTLLYQWSYLGQKDAYGRSINL